MISEQLPRLARLADKFALVRSLHDDSNGHVNSTHTLLSGYPGEVVETPPYRPRHPDVWAVTTKLLGPRRGGIPAFVITTLLSLGVAAASHRLLERGLCVLLQQRLTWRVRATDGRPVPV